MLSKKTEAYLESLTQEFELNANEENAVKQKQYMRNQFGYYGLSAGTRQQLQKPFLSREFLPEKSELEELIKILWQKPQREYQHFSQELVFKYVMKLELRDIDLLEYMVTNKSWWDTVDYIANRLLGGYFRKFPEQIPSYVDKWLASGNIWSQRSALLFQLKYKQNIDKELLSEIIQKLLGSKEFFINKAIGWVLREYSRTNQEWVIDFVHNHDLSPLSRREALRLIK